MPNEHHQPLGEQPPRSTADTELVNEVLGGQTVKEMEELTGDQPKTTKDQELSTDLVLTGDEQAAAKEAEKNIEEERRQEYYDWAKDIDKDEDWIDETFTFNTDGTVIAEGNVILQRLGIKTLPSNLIEVRGHLDLYKNQLTSLENFPQRVGRSLNLNHNPITSLKGIPNAVGESLYLNSNSDLRSLEGLSRFIGKNLDLMNTPVTSIPEGLDIGMILLKRNQTDLIADCRAKGYSIQRIT